MTRQSAGRSPVFSASAVLDAIEQVCGHLRECVANGDHMDPADWKRIERIAPEQAVQAEFEVEV